MITAGSIYRHYKSNVWDNRIYEVIGIAKHSETEEALVIYRPLYDASGEDWWQWYDLCARPLAMWDEEVEWNGKKMPRFTLIS